MCCDSEIELSKTGLLTNYPWFIENKELKVPMSHSNKQFAFGHVWMQYKNSTFRPTKESPITEIEIIKDNKDNKGTNNFYLTSWNNTEMI